MIQITRHMRILVAIEPTDFRRGIDGFARVCKSELLSDPFSGTIFVFRNRRATAIKCLVYDGLGFWLCQKRLSTGKFCFWPEGSGKTCSLQSHELQVLFSAGNPSALASPEPWRPAHMPV